MIVVRLTHFSPVSHVFRGYRNVTLDSNGLKYVQILDWRHCRRDIGWKPHLKQSNMEIMLDEVKNVGWKFRNKISSNIIFLIQYDFFLSFFRRFYVFKPIQHVMESTIIS